MQDTNLDLGLKLPLIRVAVQQQVIHTLISLHEYSEHGIPTLLLLYKDNVEVIKLVMTWYLNSFFVLFVCQWLSSVCNTEWHSYIDFATCSMKHMRYQNRCWYPDLRALLPLWVLLAVTYMYRDVQETGTDCNNYM